MSSWLKIRKHHKGILALVFYASLVQTHDVRNERCPEQEGDSGKIQTKGLILVFSYGPCTFWVLYIVLAAIISIPWDVEQHHGWAAQGSEGLHELAWGFSVV